MNTEQQRHEMVLERTHESGAEEWYCPVCGRRFLMQWPPNYKKIILEPGDDYAIHSGGKGGLSMGAPQISLDEGKMDAESDLAINEEYLTPWKEWMDKVDFESFWDRDNQ